MARPVGSKNKPKSEPSDEVIECVADFVQTSNMVNSFVEDPDFTGVARSMECFDNQGHNNFRILTLHIKNGRVIRMDRSDAYANFEAITRMELANENSVISLNNHWSNGRTLSK